MMLWTGRLLQEVDPQVCHTAPSLACTATPGSFGAATEFLRMSCHLLQCLPTKSCCAAGQDGYEQRPSEARAVDGPAVLQSSGVAVDFEGLEGEEWYGLGDSDSAASARLLRLAKDGIPGNFVVHRAKV